MIDSSSGQRAGGTARALTPTEQQVIAAILSEEILGMSDLRAQLGSARVLRNWQPEGSPSIDLATLPDTPRSPLRDSIVPVDATVVDENENYLGELILWLEDGRISSLEYAWVTDAMPCSLPAVESLRISRRTT